MTVLQIRLVKKLYKVSPIQELSEIELVNSRFADAVEIKRALEDLVTMQYVRTDPTKTKYRLTSLGRIAYHAEWSHRMYLVFNEIRAWATLAIAILSLLITLF